MRLDRTSESGTNRRLEVGQSMSALLGYFRHHLFRYCEGIIDLDAEISDRTFDLGMSEPPVAFDPFQAF